ncbi:MAG: diaminopimelate decarboxylase [Eubacteriales bacterium]|nr:diaminopimelate decarboxylase [Eubacteriales bacterium]
MLYENLSVNEKGHLTFAGLDAVELAARYGTPAYFLDENRVRENCRKYTHAFRAHFPAGSRPHFASKALCFKALYPILQEEDFGADVVSGGEMMTALAAGFPAEHICFHGNNKTIEEIRFAVEKGVGLIAVDNPTELQRVSEISGAAGKVQRVLLRLTPGIDPHTFAAVNTGKIDCQFGMAIETGQAKRFVAEALRTPNLEIVGYHCHIGSQIFDQNPFIDAARIMMDFAADIRDEYGYAPEVLNLGGGFGVRYVESDPHVDIPACIGLIAKELRILCAERSMPLPAVHMEPGRSIVADACITLYTAGPVKTIEGYRSYAVIDGGMSDNPRYALYGSAYTVLVANKALCAPESPITIAGRCCESGALIQENVALPRVETGDIIAVLTTGAYNYSMASNYNRICRPPVVLIKDGECRLGVRRETWEDMTACDL